MTMTDTISLIVGIIGTFISVYQWASINASKGRLREIQFVLAGIHSSVLMKQVGWQNQLSFHANPSDEKSKELFRMIFRAKDDFAELANLISALEGTISTDDSAIFSVMKMGLEQSKLNNELQQEALKNPSPPKNWAQN
jgi:hypothetical protein